jgi:hypothetical protein
MFNKCVVLPKEPKKFTSISVDRLEMMPVDSYSFGKDKVFPYA